MKTTEYAQLNEMSKIISTLLEDVSRHINNIDRHTSNEISEELDGFIISQGANIIGDLIRIVIILLKDYPNFCKARGIPKERWEKSLKWTAGIDLELKNVLRRSSLAMEALQNYALDTSDFEQATLNNIFKCFAKECIAKYDNCAFSEEDIFNRIENDQCTSITSELKDSHFIRFAGLFRSDDMLIGGTIDRVSSEALYNLFVILKSR